MNELYETGSIPVVGGHAGDYCWYCLKCGRTFHPDHKPAFIKLNERLYHEIEDCRLCGPLRFLRPGDPMVKTENQDLELTRLNKTSDELETFCQGVDDD